MASHSDLCIADSDHGLDMQRRFAIAAGGTYRNEGKYHVPLDPQLAARIAHKRDLFNDKRFDCTDTVI